MSGQLRAFLCLRLRPLLDCSLFFPQVRWWQVRGRQPRRKERKEGEFALDALSL